MNDQKPAKKRSRKAEPLASGNVLQLKITLRYLKPPIWRRLLVRDNTTLGKLHFLIQRAMGWGGGHLHEFRMPARGFGPPVRRFGHDGENEDRTLVSDLLVRPRQVLLYEYDFGDGWLHGIELEKVLPPEPGEEYPKCRAGARACPPDDCGGPPGYDALVRAVRNPSAAANAQLLEWCGDFDPEAFDPDFANRCIAGL